MTHLWLLPLLLSLALSSFSINLGQPAAAEADSEEKGRLEEILQRAENLFLQSNLQKLEEEGENNSDLQASPLDWLVKRQHPGKRFSEIFEKRQHPGKREEEDEGEEEEWGDEGAAIEIHRRQHPGKREEEAWEEDGKEQKRQHPGRRASWLKDSEGDISKRQHPGKRSPDPASQVPVFPCSPRGSSHCSLLLELLEDLRRGPGPEKRQHPGRRSLWGADREED
ncbi:thyrotropin releasing hormone [Antechinus flavipes]|uniref:thyrotropin releasing hormone n=1 Tax=Antechinus flavipes TaxID=38775 RepID=UPI00223624EE|nr:thyrotropin releasing hormone [Antechinus flavipes]XP_051838838.1 thyrotropin releasing hormone [Antechinus flavipes]